MSIINDTDREIKHVFEDINFDPIDTAQFSGIIARVFQRGVEIDKFSLNTQTGFGDIISTAPSTSGEISFYINAEKLRQAIDGFSVYYEIKTEKTNINFENNTEESSTGEIFIGKLLKTKLTNQTFN